MNKKLLILSVMIAMLFVAGCGTATKDDANKVTTTVCTYEKETDKDTENFSFTLTATGDAITHATIIYDYTFKDQDTYNAKKNDSTFRDYSTKFYTVTFVI
jgi:major membrane immunogen (membrane-anchored lipoprotein)